MIKWPFTYSLLSTSMFSIKVRKLKYSKFEYIRSKHLISNNKVTLHVLTFLSTLGLGRYGMWAVLFFILSKEIENKIKCENHHGMIVDNEAKYRTIIIQSLTDCRSFSCDKVCYGFIYRIKDISIIHDHKTINTDKKGIPGFFSCDTYKIAQLTNSRRRNKTRKQNRPCIYFFALVVLGWSEGSGY